MLKKILSTLSTIILFTGFKQLPATTTSLKEPRKEVWSISTGVGMNWKPKAEAIHNKWIGFVATTGINWQKPLAQRCTFSAGLLWGLFLPDMFMANKPTKFPFKIIKKIEIPYNLALFIPMTSLQLGYFFNHKWHLSCGLIYFYALECNLNYLLSSRLSLNGRYCLFLDKFFKNCGIHLGFATIGIDYKL